MEDQEETIKEGGGKQLRVDCNIAAAVELARDEAIGGGGGGGGSGGLVGSRLPQHRRPQAGTEGEREEKLRQHAGSGGKPDNNNGQQQENSELVACSNNIHTSSGTNQAEMIADDSAGALKDNNMNYSGRFVELNEHPQNHRWPKQGDLCCPPTTGHGCGIGQPEGEQEEEKRKEVGQAPERERAGGGGGGGGSRLLEIVERAESKLMRQSGRHGSDLLPNRNLKRQPMSLLLKSPAFATNTLDEAHLDKLATGGEGGVGRKTTTILVGRRSEEGSEKCANHVGARRRAGDQPATAGPPAFATNMTNRLDEEKNDNNNEHKQQQQRGASADDGDKQQSSRPDIGLSRRFAIPFGEHHRQSGCLRADDSEALKGVRQEARREAPNTCRESAAAAAAAGPGGSSLGNGKLAACDYASSQNEDDDDDDDYDDLGEEREAPTPTNDLIRALIHKDRQALGVRGGGAGGGDSKRPSCCERNSSTGDLGLGPRRSSNSREQKQRNLVFDLIGKCQRLHLSPLQPTKRAPEAENKQAPYQQFGLNRCNSPRKPSDPSALLRAQQVAETIRANLEQQAQLQMRRHSTYMLPILLNSKNPRPGDETSSSSSGGPSPDKSNSSCNAGPEPCNTSDEAADYSDGQVARNPNERKRDSNNFRLASEPQTASFSSTDELNEVEDEEEDEDEEDLDKDLLMVEGRDFKRGNPQTALRRHQLTNSASSPSALSTPTNERPGHGCDGPCCMPGRLPVPPTVPHKQPGRCETIRQQIFARLHNHYQRQHEQVEVASKRRRGRKRLGSNPLDRFRAGSEQQPGSRRGVVARKIAESSMSKSTGKRHSIINIFSSNQPGHRLFSSLSNHQNNQQARLSNGNLETQEPLIPESGFKIVVMGTSGSGKTSIIQRFMYNSFTWRHLPTVEDTYFIEFPYMKNTINISISDTSGTYQFPAMRKLAINSGDAFILVYSVDNVQSFDELETLRQTILDEREQAYLEASGSINSTESASSAFASGSNASSTSVGHYWPITAPGPGQHHQQQPPPAANSGFDINRDTLAPHHWSLASLFHNNNSNQTNATSSSSLASSVGGQTSLSSSLSNCSSTENSRRSSISAAEAALKTRRTRHPPIVIVANKHDLPEDQHLVNSDEIEALAVIDWNNGFVRASAALDWNINEIFQQVLKQARQPQTLADAIVSKRRKSLPPKLPHSMISNNSQYSYNNNKS